jgi:hypothetical protein
MKKLFVIESGNGMYFAGWQLNPLHAFQFKSREEAEAEMEELQEPLQVVEFEPPSIRVRKVR